MDFNGLLDNTPIKGLKVLKVEDIFKDLPLIETERLILRNLTEGDINDVFEYTSDPEVAKYVPWEYHKSIDTSKSFVEYTINNYNSGNLANWGIVHKEDNKLIGGCGFVHWEPEHFKAEVGYTLARKYWGKGLVSEAVRTLLKFGFERMYLNRIQAKCVTENIGSARVMEKNGLKFEGITRQSVFRKGRFWDMKLYSILRDEYYGLNAD